jgi:hypothetical protein
VTLAFKRLTGCCYPSAMSRLALSFFCVGVLLFLSACGAITPPAMPAPAPICEKGQANTPENPCTPGPGGTEDGGNTGGGDGGTGGGDTGGGDTGGNPASCETTEVKPRFNAKLLSSQTTLKSCYAPGDSATVFMSVKLEDSTIVFVDPTLVFDIVRVNANRSTTTVAGPLLGNQAPGVNPDIFRGDISKEQLVSGLEAAVSFKFSSKATPGKYVMVLSLFKDRDAFNPANLVSRIFYDFEIK